MQLPSCNCSKGQLRNDKVMGLVTGGSRQQGSYLLMQSICCVFHVICFLQSSELWLLCLQVRPGMPPPGMPPPGMAPPPGMPPPMGMMPLGVSHTAQHQHSGTSLQWTSARLQGAVYLLCRIDVSHRAVDAGMLICLALVHSQLCTWLRVCQRCVLYLVVHTVLGPEQ